MEHIHFKTEEQIHLRLSERLQNLSEDSRIPNLNLAFLLDKLGVSSHALVVFIFSLPFLLPIPIPGLSVVLGALIALSGLAIAIDKPIWLPAIIANRNIDGSLIAKIFLSASRLLKRVEFLFKPRLINVSENWGVRIFTGLLIFLSGVLLFLPLPPGTNFPPAIVCVLLAVGLLERDGLCLLIGFGAFALKLFLIFNMYNYISGWISANWIST